MSFAFPSRGSANANHMVITGANDYSLDWTDGWDGLVQHLYIAQDDTVECDEGNESDNNGSTMYAEQFGGDCDVARFMMTQSNIITDMDPLLICPEAGPHPKPFPQAESHVGMIGNSARPSDDNWFDTTAQYHGAFSPHPMGPNRNWIKEWANFLRPNDIESILAGLACISHHPTAEARHTAARTSLRLLAVLNVLFKYACARQAARASS